MLGDQAAESIELIVNTHGAQGVPVDDGPHCPHRLAELLLEGGGQPSETQVGAELDDRVGTVGVGDVDCFTEPLLGLGRDLDDAAAPQTFDMDVAKLSCCAG